MAKKKTKIGQAIRDLRESRGLDQGDLAALVDMDAGNLSRIERGGQQPREDLLFAIAAALETPVSRLYEMVESPGNRRAIIRAYNRELAKLEEVYLCLNTKKRKQALRLLQALREE